MSPASDLEPHPSHLTSLWADALYGAAAISEEGGLLVVTRFSAFGPG